MMGLFGSRKKTTVGTSVARVISDEQLPNSIVTGGMKSLMSGNGQLANHAMEELASGLGTRVHSMYRYGRDGYINGLPSGTSMNSLQGKATIKQAIEADVGGEVGIEYYEAGPLNLLHIGWMRLVNDYGYDSITNTFQRNGRAVFLSNMQPVVTDASLEEMENGSLDQWGIPPTAGVSPAMKYNAGIGQLSKPAAFVVDSAAGIDFIRVQYCWEESEQMTVEGVPITRDVLKTGEMQLIIPALNMTSDYHQAKYSKNGKAAYWIYQIGSNANPAIEAVFATAPKPNGTFFPFAYFRYGKKNMALVNNDEAKSQKKLLKYINMDFADVAEAINENPDIADVEQAMLTLAVPARTDDPMEQRYLFDFFNNLWTAADLQGATSLSENAYAIAGKLKSAKAASTIVIQDKKFKMALSWDTIVRRRVAGSIGVIGAHDNAVNFKSETKSAETLAGLPVNWTTDAPVHAYRRQVTENMYEEILVRNLKMTYHVFGEYTTTGDDENDSILMIPLDYEITRYYSVSDRENLYARSLHYIFNSMTVIKLKWYQTGIFKIIMVIVAVVVTVISYGSLGPIAAAWTAGGFTAVAALLVPIVAKYLIVSFVVKKFVQVVGGKIALILAVIAAVAGFYQVATNGSLANAPWAKELLQASSSLSNAAGAQFKRDFRDLQGDFRSFSEFAKTEQEKLDSSNKLLDSNSHLMPITIFGETPDDFYQRTVHSGNIGVIGIDAVEVFVSSALKLPKLSDSEGNFV